MGESLSEHAARAGERALEMAGAAPPSAPLLTAATANCWEEDCARQVKVCPQVQLQQMWT